MFNIFQQPWTMLIVAIISMVVIFIIRSIWPNKQRLWQLFIPVLIAILAFGLDYFVKTDRELIDSLIDTGMSVADTRQTQVLNDIVSDNYSDSSRQTKTELIAYCQAVLSEKIIKQCNEMGRGVDITSNNEATSLLTIKIILDKSAGTELEAVPFLILQTRLSLQKEADKKWRVVRTELLKLNNQPINWTNRH